MKWLTVDNRYVRKDSNVIFLDEEDNTHTFTVSDYASGRGVGTVGALGMDLWGIQLLLLGDLSAFENHTMKSVRIYTVDGYFDFKIKNGASKKLTKFRTAALWAFIGCLLKVIISITGLVVNLTPLLIGITDIISMCLIGFFFISLYTKIGWKIDK